MPRAALTSSAVQKEASAFLYICHTSWYCTGKMTKRRGFSRNSGSSSGRCGTGSGGACRTRGEGHGGPWQREVAGKQHVGGGLAGTEHVWGGGALTGLASASWKIFRAARLARIRVLLNVGGCGERTGNGA